MSMPIIIGHFPRPCRSQRHVMNTIQNEKSVEREIYSLNWLIQRNVSAEIAQNAPTDQIELRMEIRQRSKQEELDRRKVVRVIMLSVMLLIASCAGHTGQLGHGRLSGLCDHAGQGDQSGHVGQCC